MNKSITQANEFKTISHLSKTVFNKPDISTYEVWGISPEGFYIGMVPTKYENGKLTISLGTESRSMYYRHKLCDVTEAVIFGNCAKLCFIGKKHKDRCRR